MVFKCSRVLFMSRESWSRKSRPQATPFINEDEQITKQQCTTTSRWDLCFALCKLWLKIFNYTLSCWKTKDTDQGDTLIDAKCCFPIILINGFSFLTFVVWKQKLSQEFHSVKKMLEQQMLCGKLLSFAWTLQVCMLC